MSKFLVDILTPSEIICKEISATSIKVPTTRGEIEILSDHTHIIEKLDTGILEIADGAKPSRFVVTTGIIKILGKKVTILSNVAETETKIDKARAQKALKAATKKLQEEPSLPEDIVIKFQRKIDRAKTRIMLSS